MATSSPTRRASKARMARTLRDLETQTAQTRELPGPIAALIANYASPHLTDTQVPAVRRFMRDVLIASSIHGTQSALKHRTHLAGLSSFALNRGLALQVSTVMTTDLIDDEKLTWDNAGDDAYEKARYVAVLYNTAIMGISLLFDINDAYQYHVCGNQNISRSRWTTDQLQKNGEGEKEMKDVKDETA